MARQIKRYENRKLYDTAASEYVSLGDIADLVRRGETVKVVDNATGQDLTAQTLTQIILEEGRSGREVIPSDLLHDLLRRSGEALDTGIDRIRATVDELMQGSVTQLKRLVQTPRQEEYEELRQELDRLDRRVSALLDDLAEAKPAGGATQSGPSGPVKSTGPEARNSEE